MAEFHGYSAVRGWFIWMLEIAALMAGVCFLEAARVIRRPERRTDSCVEEIVAHYERKIRAREAQEGTLSIPPAWGDGDLSVAGAQESKADRAT